jgi:hypothetical protein
MAVSFNKVDLTNLNNIGDQYCTPDAYFQIESCRDIVIVGGGAQQEDKLESSKKSKKMVVWGIGKSLKGPVVPYKKEYSFLEYGFRDYDLLENKSKFLPCVSCLNKDIIESPTNDKVLIFINANTDVSPNIEVYDTENVLFLKNDCSLEEFLAKWSQCSKVVTNSYHGIYWSLLSGREVLPFWYSSKIKSVLSLFNLEPSSDNFYRSTDSSLIEKMIYFNNSDFLQSVSCRLNEFRDINLSFAAGLNKYDILCKEIDDRNSKE